jgi:hypothetical protein
MRSLPVTLTLLLAAAGCSPKKPAQAADEVETTETNPHGSGERPKRAPHDPKASETPSGEDATPRKDECAGAEIYDLEGTLTKVACETATPKPDERFPDPKDKLEIRVSLSAPKVAPGGHLDVMVTYVNKTKEPMPLLFTVDPVPRFEVEAYDAKSHRVDLPGGQPPPLPRGVSARGPGEAKTAKVVLAAGGMAKVQLGWDAVRTRWAPEKVRGAAPEKGYPRAPAGALPRGKYTLRVVTPLVGWVEGLDKEVSAPKVTVEVAR